MDGVAWDGQVFSVQVFSLCASSGQEEAGRDAKKTSALPCRVGHLDRPPAILTHIAIIALEELIFTLGWGVVP